MANELEVYVKDSGLEATKAQYILDNFSGYFQVAAEWEAKAKGIVVTDDSQTGLMKMARAGRLFLRDKRIAVENARKHLKEQSLREGKAIDGIANILKALIVPIEEHLYKQEHFVRLREEAEAEKKRLELEAKERAEQEAREEAEAKERERIRQENIRLQKEAEARQKEIEKEREAREKAEEKKRAALRAKQRAKEAKEKAEKEAAEAEERAAEAEKKRKEEERKRKKAEERQTWEAKHLPLVKCPHCGKTFRLDQGHVLEGGE